MYNSTLSDIKEILKLESSPALCLQQICTSIHKQLPAYDWVGFYFMNHQNRKLYLGPYEGDPTDHTIIDFGKGICGQVAVSGDTYMAEDVNAESNYIACSLNVKSEIVVPMYQGEKLIGQIDIDSHQLKRFKEEDEAFLKAVNTLIVEQYPDLPRYIESLF